MGMRGSLGSKGLLDVGWSGRADHLVNQDVSHDGFGSEKFLERDGSSVEA